MGKKWEVFCVSSCYHIFASSQKRKELSASQKMARRKKQPSPQQVVEELAAIGFARVGDHLVLDGDQPVLKLPDGAAVASIERTSSGLKVKFYDKLKALELLGKHMGLFDGAAKPVQSNNELLEAILEATRQLSETHEAE